MVSELLLSEIPDLSKTNAVKQLTSAVRESQNAPRATYKPHGRPAWWTINANVVLADGSNCTVTSFKNPKDMTVSALKAALHLYVQSMGNVEDDTSHDFATEQSSADLKDGETSNHTNIISEDVGRLTKNAMQAVENNVPSSHLQTTDCKQETVAVDINVTQNIDDKRSLLKRVNVGTHRDDIGQFGESTAKRLKKTSTINVDLSLVGKGINDELHRKRLEFIHNLREKKSSLAYNFQMEGVRKVKQLARNEAELRDDLNTRLGRLDMWYAKKTIDIPSALLNTTMSELVEKYGMSKEKWLHDNVSHIVERAMRNDHTANHKSNEKGDAGADAVGSQTPKASARQSIPVTPPTRTPAARKRLEEVQNTISKTVRRVRKEQGCLSTVTGRKLRPAKKMDSPDGAEITVSPIDTRRVEHNIDAFVTEFRISRESANSNSKNFKTLFFEALQQQRVFEKFLSFVDEVKDLGIR